MDENDLRRERRICSRIGLTLVVALTVPLAWQLGLTALFAALLPEEGAGNTALQSVFYLLLLVGAYVIVLPAAAALLRRVPHFRPPVRPVSPKSLVRWFVIGYALLYLGAWLGTAVNNLAYRLADRPPVDVLSETMGSLPLAVIVLGACILGPICEETLFRFFIAGRLTRYGEAPAAVVSALLFALFHANLGQFFYAFALGVLFAYAYFRTGRLWVSCALHMALNFCGSVLPMALDGAADGALALYTLLLLALVAGGLTLLLLHARHATWEHGAYPPSMRAVFGNWGMTAAIVVCFVQLACGFVLY